MKEHPEIGDEILYTELLCLPAKTAVVLVADRRSEAMKAWFLQAHHGLGYFYAGEINTTLVLRADWVDGSFRDDRQQRVRVCRYLGDMGSKTI